MAVELRRSSEFSMGELAALFTVSYEGYVVPFSVDEPTFTHMVDAFDLDLHKSFVAIEDGSPVGLANLGRRRERTWLGGIGVVPNHRRAGVGEQLTRALLDRARAAGANEMVLEVIVENTPAIALYEKLGFVRTRELDVLSLPAADGTRLAEEIDLDDALGVVAVARKAPEPWQRADDTVANLRRRDPPPRAVAADGGVAVYREDAGRVALLQASGDADELGTLLADLRRRAPVYALNYPTGGTVAAALLDASARVVARQYEMAVKL